MKHIYTLLILCLNTSTIFCQSNSDTTITIDTIINIDTIIVTDTLLFSDTVVLLDSTVNLDSTYELFNDSSITQLTCATYVEDIQPIFNQYCKNCHSNYANYSGTQSSFNNGSLRNRVITLKNMPPSGNLSDEELRLFECWLDSLAPNTTSEDIIYDTIVSLDSALSIDTLGFQYDTSTQIKDTFSLSMDTTFNYDTMIIADTVILSDSVINFIMDLNNESEIIETLVYSIDGRFVGVWDNIIKENPLKTGFYIFINRSENGIITRKKRFISNN